MLYALLLMANAFVAFGRSIPGFATAPKDWYLDARSIPGDRDMTVKFALVPKDAALLEKELIERSTPGSKKFRQYLTQSEIADIVAPTQSNLNAVSEWISNFGGKVVEIPAHRDWVVASLPVASIEKMLSCKLVTYRNDKMLQSTMVAAEGYTIPDSLSHIVQMVSGLNSFPKSHRVVTIESGVSVAQSITPDTIYTNYQTPNSGSHGSKVGSQAVVEFGALANFNDQDLQTFFDEFAAPLVGETCGVVYGTNNGKIRPSVEANLDVQYIMAAGVYVNTTDYKITGDGNIEDEFLEYTYIVNNQTQPPLVHSISYGAYGGSYDNETDQRFSYELQKMGISGISVLLASGDNGVGCNAAGTSQEFDYPSSPYITMVGATYIDAATKEEIGATLSSGGFSKDFMMPEWQMDAVNAYMNSGVQMPSEYFYAPGRAYPDIAAYGQNVQIVASGKTEGVSGTSCSAPIFAGVVAQINDQLISSGQAPLGFLNPWLYANPQMFTDITAGSNPYQKCDGFLATTGWDPVTGMGTPLYPKMLDAAFEAVGAKVPQRKPAM